MRKVTTIVVITALLSTCFLVFNGCKKGEDDPFLSFRSRKARMTGDWKLVAGTSTDKSTDLSTNITTTLTTVYDGTTATETTTVGSTSNSSTVPYTQSISFKKDGTFTSTETDNGSTTTSSGTWDFTSGTGKDLKKKEQVILYYNAYSSPSYSFNMTGYTNSVVMNIRQLKNNELVLTFDYTSTDSNSNDEYKSEWTYQQ